MPTPEDLPELDYPSLREAQAQAGLDERLRNSVFDALCQAQYGRHFWSENFLCSVLRDAVDHKKVVLRTSLDCEKDYLDVLDVVPMLPQIAASGRQRIYNVARGVNTANRALLELVQRIMGCRLEVAEGAATVPLSPISIERIQEEFDFVPSRVLDSPPDLIAEFQRRALAA